MNLNLQLILKDMRIVKKYKTKTRKGLKYSLITELLLKKAIYMSKL